MKFIGSISATKNPEALIALVWIGKAVLPRLERQAKKTWVHCPSPLLSAQLLLGWYHSEKVGHCSHPQLQTLAQRFCLGGESGHQADKSSSLPRGTDFICSRVWRSSILRGLSAAEDVVKGSWKEVGGIDPLSILRISDPREKDTLAVEFYEQATLVHLPLLVSTRQSAAFCWATLWTQPNIIVQSHWVLIAC